MNKFFVIGILILVFVGAGLSAAGEIIVIDGGFRDLPIEPTTREIRLSNSVSEPFCEVNQIISFDENKLMIVYSLKYKVNENTEIYIGDFTVHKNTSENDIANTMISNCKNNYDLIVSNYNQTIRQTTYVSEIINKSYDLNRRVFVNTTREIQEADIQ